MRTYQVIFKNETNRQAFIGLHSEYLGSFDFVTFAREEYKAEPMDGWEDTSYDGQPMITVTDKENEQDFDELWKNGVWKRWDKLRNNFSHGGWVDGENIVDFTSGDDAI